MLEGDLTDFSIPEVLRLLSFTAKTGRLEVAARTAGPVASTPTGRVDLVDGRIRDASADAERLPLARRVLGTGLVSGGQVLDALAGASTLPTDLELARRLATAGVGDVAALADLVREHTIDALFDLLRWDDGSFRFTATDGEARGPSVLDLAIPVDDALDETARRLDAWPSLVDRTGAADAVVAIEQPGRERAEVSLAQGAWALLALVDGQRPIDELAVLGGQGAYRTRRHLVSLVDAGVVTIDAPGVTSRVATLLHDHAALARQEAALTGRPASVALPATAALAATAAPHLQPAPRTTGWTTSPAASPAVASVVPPPDVPAAAAAASPAVPSRGASPDASPAAPAASAASAVAFVAASPGSWAEPGTGDGQRPTGSSATRPPLAGEPPSAVVRRLARTGPRRDRVRTVPEVDEELVTRLIAGVEAL